MQPVVQFELHSSDLTKTLPFFESYRAMWQFGNERRI